MKSLMLLLALGLVSSDKLDRTYLPPPGSKIAGGSDGAIQVPLEFPKETYSTTVRPLTPGQKQDGLIPIGDAQRTTGIRLPNIQPGSHDVVPVTPGSNTLFGYLQNKVPTTTTTYAFTQTTTFAPPEGFETTVSPIGFTGFPSDVSQDIQNGIDAPSGQNQGVPQPSGPVYIQPGNQIVQQPGVPTHGTVHHPGYQTPSQTFIGHPGYNQPSVTQYLPGQTPSTTISPIPGSQTQSPFNQEYTQHLGVQPPRQFGQKVLSSTPAPQGVPQTHQPGASPVYYGNAVQRPVSGPIASQQIRGQRPQNFEQQNLQTTVQPGMQYVTDNLGNIIPISNSLELGGQRPLFGGQVGPSQPGVSPQLINNIQRIPEPNLPQELGAQPSVFNGAQAPSSPISSIVTQPGSYPQYNNILSGLNFSQPGVQGQQGHYPTSGSQSAYYTDVPQSQRPLNNQAGIIPGSTSSQFFGNQQPQFINQPGFIPATASPQGITPSYQPASSQPGVIQSGGVQSSMDQLGIVPSGVIHTGHPPTGSYQPGSTQSPAIGSSPQTTSYPGDPARIIPGKPFLQPTLGSINQNNYQITDGKFPLQPYPGRSGAQSIGLGSTVPAAIAHAQYKLPSYSSTTVNTIPNSFPSTTISPIRITSSTPYAEPGQTGVTPGRISRPERPQAEFDGNSEILSYKNIITPDGEFEYSFDTSNGIHADENGTSIDGVKAEGSYSYIGDDGKLYSIVYSADENGFRPQGAHLPTPPPIPEAIQKVIEQAAKDKEAGISHDGYYDEDKYGHMNYQNPNRMHSQRPNKFIANGADIPNDYDEVLRSGQTKPGPVKSEQIKPDQVRPGEVTSGLVRPGTFKPGSKGDGSQTHRKPNTDVYKDEYISESNDQFGELRENQDVRKPGSGISSKRPLDTTDERQYKYIYDGDKLVTSDKKPLPTGYRGDSRDRYLPGATESSSRLPTTGKKPVNRPGSSIDDGYETAVKYINEDEDVITHYEEESRLPSMEPEVKSYEQYGQKLPGRLDQQYSVTGRPAETKRPISTTMRYSDEDEYTRQTGVQRPNQPGRRPLKPSSGSKYTESEDNGAYYENNVPRSDIVSEKPQGSRRPVSQNSYYPEQTRRPGQPGSINNNNEEVYDQGDAHRLYDQGKQSMGNKYPLQLEYTDSGYQYLPPQHKFQETEMSSTRLSSEFTTRRPVTKVQPFITPNVYRDENTSDEDKDQVGLSRTPGLGIKSPDGYESTEGPSYDEKEIEGDLEIGDDYSTFMRVRPEKPGSMISSTGRPYPSQQTTSRPQYGDEYSDDRSIQQGIRPQYGGSKHTKPSSQSRPGQIYSKDKVEGSKKPSYIMSSTTPMPSGGRGLIKDRTQYEQPYETGSDGPVNHYSNQYFPTSTTIPGMRIPGQQRPGIGGVTIPGSNIITPGQVDNSRAPSQPLYQYGDRTTPGVSRAPSNRPGGRINDYSTTPQTETYRPGTSSSGPDSIYIDQTQSGYSPETSGAFRRPTTYYPGAITTVSNTVRPGTKIPGRPGIQNIPSTTYRPNYTIIDETTGRPITVDALGTPVSIMYGPEYSINRGPNTFFDQPGPTQGSGTSGVQTTAEVFQPNEPRFEPTNPPSVGIQRPGSQVSSTTQRIIGEDFSGPKQPQRFDPETGYHY